MNIIYNAWSFLILKVNALQADLNKLQGQQVSLQLEHKELKKKQRRSERYYTNKQTKDGGSQNDSVQGDDVEMVGDVSLQDDLTQEDDRSEEGWFTKISEIVNFKVPYIIMLTGFYEWHLYKMLVTVEKVYFTGFWLQSSGQTQTFHETN